MAIQIGKYKRPGIFIEEFDQSVITSPTVEGVTSMVIGFSKKGPVNTPVLLQNTNDLQSIFGSIDRNLERKGNFFHRTITKMLESTPVYAVNLLLTDDTLDTIEYQSLSSATDKSNDVEQVGPYRRFFDTTGFWKRDTESFINLTKSDPGYTNRVLNFTNLSDRYITTFVFKSRMTGFDRTLIEWYGSVENLPPYVNQTDWASDYMVDVIVVGGDWSNYQELSIDPRWSQYFAPQGLRKDQIYNFANDRNVTLLSFYEGLSMIPYFRDANGNNIFIETVINRDTDRTGLFCAFNADLFETDYPTGLVDLIGNNLVGKENVSINFLSYNDTIVEAIEFTKVYLDRPGNVSGIDGPVPSLGVRSTYLADDTRTGWFAEGFVNGVNLDTYTTTTSSIDITYGVSTAYPDATGTFSYAIIGGNLVQVAGTASFQILPSSYPGNGTFSSVVILDSTGNISKIDNLLGSKPSVAASDIVLGSFTFVVSGGQFATGSFTKEDITVDASGYKELVFGTASGEDYYISNIGTSNDVKLKIEFIDTNVNPSTANYASYRRIKLFNHLVNLLDSTNKDKMSMIVDFTTFEKKSLENMTITNIVTSTSVNKSFVINTGLSDAVLADVLDGNFLLYTVDDELILGEETMTTKDAVADSSDGVVAKYSSFYQRYNDGIINTGNFFYANLIADTFNQVTFLDENGQDYVLFYKSTTPTGWPVSPTAEFGDALIVPSSVLNTGTFVLTDSTNYATTLGFGSGYYAYKVAQNTTPETLSNVSVVYNYNKKHYLQMYFDSTNTLYCSFMDATLTTPEPVDLDLNVSFKVQSERANYKQTIEIEVPAGYTQVPNKILVKGTRYTEIKVGDFLQAYVDTSLIVPGQMPKNLTRILSKKLYAADTSLVEITCDARINKVAYGTGGDLQTTRYTSIEDYVSTYKAISLKGFRIREASLPDGTETRQNAILNLVGKGTPLFRAITNKEALDFRYLVDPFGLGLTERSKQQLVDICGERLDTFGFINMPSMKQFKNSSSPSFVDNDPTSPNYGTLSIEFVSKGGDPESNPAFLYSFGEGRGVTTVGYFAPYLVVNDNGRPMDVPPAMFVATTYMRKQITNITSIVPWTIAAGTTNGRITGIAGVEMDFTPEDIEWLNQAQMNPIVFKRNRGYIIETENTAQTLYRSALSYIHVREVLIELERELSRMLLDFQWKFNTSDVRAEIKLRADIICEQYVTRRGLYNYFNKCDEENNTPDVIDNQIGVLDTYVEPIKGMGVIVNNVTILRTGAIQSGGFIS